jgi:hypothetical protein
MRDSGSDSRKLGWNWSLGAREAIVSDVDTIPLRRAVKEIDSVHKDLKALEDQHGPNSPQVVELLMEMAHRLSAHPGNETFVIALRSRIQRLQAAVAAS